MRDESAERFAHPFALNPPRRSGASHCYAAQRRLQLQLKLKLQLKLTATPPTAIPTAASGNTSRLNAARRAGTASRSAQSANGTKNAAVIHGFLSRDVRAMRVSNALPVTRAMKAAVRTAESPLAPVKSGTR